MKPTARKLILLPTIALFGMLSVGCASTSLGLAGLKGKKSCDSTVSCDTKSCDTKGCKSCKLGLGFKDCDLGCKSCNGCGFLGWGWWNCRHLAIPDTLPLGTTVRAHYHTMETNAEASDFVLHRYEFVDSTAELTPAGKDHIVEVAARMKSAPFPVVVERSEHNSDPELDAVRRELVAAVLTDFGVPEADQRTFVSPAYNKAANSAEARMDYYNFIYTRGGNNVGFNGGNTGFGGFGGGGFGF
ncbi:hypothetical protein [Calycomorphotria hydatis]|uniref:Lipoprotein n=1 Tax=Calycomorphotria hydatis TaxID=2528027 RepID=A0A517T5U8_9PLAN|nr:hypothetical protein [Calycomorphotria hydatis]QDT63739.1 hypothetical protein V22_09640 [Calycomorphotria hydatis]